MMECSEQIIECIYEMREVEWLEKVFDKGKLMSFKSFDIFKVFPVENH
jgi:hypothetical protein